MKYHTRGCLVICLLIDFSNQFKSKIEILSWASFTATVGRFGPRDPISQNKPWLFGKVIKASLINMHMYIATYLILAYSLFPSYTVLDLSGFADTRFSNFDKSNDKSVQFSYVQCTIHCIFTDKLKSLKSKKYQNVRHESYQINDKVYKSTKLNQKYQTINCILAENCEIRLTLIFELHGFLGNAQTAYLGYRLYSHCRTVTYYKSQMLQTQNN